MSKQLPDIQTQFAEWYNEIVYAAQLADHSPVRGSAVIRPYGFAIWEHIRDTLDKKIKETGHQNAAFPLLIPKSFLEREAKHVEGFSPELAVVTHAGGKELEEPLVVRPTSETIIHYMFAQWLKSWRDLPIKINQWANVVRWEMRTRPFLRTSEFYWQEGHTAHETAQEAHDEALLMLQTYVDIYQEYLAIPVVKGVKSESEKFAGADKTYTVEGLMQDGKGLQMCTSHLISQNFAKSFNMQFQNREGKQAYPYLTSWGFTTRSIGALVMTHGDQKGLIVPPRVAPIQVVIVPIIRKEGDAHAVHNAVGILSERLNNKQIRVHADMRDYETPGAKFYEWELKGVPVRIEIGPRDVAANACIVVNRVTGTKETIAFDALVETVAIMLDDIHHQLFARAQERIRAQWHKGDLLPEFVDELENKGGWYQAGWCTKESCEAQLKNYKATIRCLLEEKIMKRCFACADPAITDVLIARAY
ncbi:MAG: proline--tRNA ligase [Candidatus Babeliales bacterium]